MPVKEKNTQGNSPIRKIKLGMVGGGPGSFIGKIHAKAAQLDGQIELVCGAFDVDPAKSKIQGKEYYHAN